MTAPATKVWSAVADLTSQVDWMRDARSIEFVGARTRGLGAKMAVDTRLGPFRTRDLLEVIGWEEGRSITVSHHGLVRGMGTISVVGDEDRSRVVWRERLVFPWWLGGPVGAWLAAPVLGATMRANLRTLEALVSSP